MNLFYEDYGSFGVQKADTVFNRLELDLFPSWRQFINSLEDNGGQKSLLSTRPVKYILGYLLTLFFLSVTVYVLFYSSLLEGEKLAQKLDISIPSFEKIDSFQVLSEIKKLDLPIFDSQKLDPPKKFALSERDSTESEIEYIDYDQLKNRFNSLATGKNKFEEETQGVFRETRYGYSTVYRLMIETPDSFEVLRILNGLRDKYKLEKAGDVEPGTFIPGGNYYNLLIENHKVEKFLEDASTLKPMIYASRSKGRSVPGKTKLFIFVNKL